MITVLKDDDFIGFLSFHSDGKIAHVHVNEDFRRKGIATKMFQLAKERNPLLHHSDRLTDDGSKWKDSFN